MRSLLYYCVTADIDVWCPYMHIIFITVVLVIDSVREHIIIGS